MEDDIFYTYEEETHVAATNDEKSHWVNNGCKEVSDSCYRCPLPLCREEELLRVQKRKTVEGFIKYLHFEKKFSQELIVILLDMQPSTVRNAFSSRETLEELEPYYTNEWLLNYAKIGYSK